jgi:hypothetical protein
MQETHEIPKNCFSDERRSMKQMKRIVAGAMALMVMTSSSWALERPVVDLSVDHGPILHNGNGFHGSLSENVDRDRVIALKPAVLRRYGRQTIEVAKATDAQVVCLLPHYDEGENWKNNWGAWESKVRQRVREITAAHRDHGINYHYDIWNEPDNWQVPDYNEFWCKTAVLLRELDDDAMIAGPSYSYSGGLQEFVTYTDQYSRQHQVNARPDILNWHEFSDPMKIIADARQTRQWLADSGFDQYVKKLTVNELMMSPMPDDVPRMFAATEIARIDWAGCGYGYRGPDQLNGLVKEDGKTPNGAWHGYKFYAQMTGRVVGIEHSQNVNVFATFDESTRQIKLLLGTKKNRVDDVELVLENLSATGLFGTSGTARVQTERYKIWGGVDRQYDMQVHYTDDTLRLPLSGLIEGVDLLPGSDKHGMAITVTYVPEPASIGLMGLGSLAMRRWRSRP